MPVPKTKTELIDQSEHQFKGLFDLIDSYSIDEQRAEFPQGTMNRNIRDVLAHLHHWHLMLLNWYRDGMKDIKPEMPAKSYTWKDTKALNVKIWQTYRNHDLEDVKSDLVRSHRQVIDIIQKHSESELFEKKIYPWTGSSSMATYLRANTSSHYKWAHHLIKKAKK